MAPRMCPYPICGSCGYYLLCRDGYFCCGQASDGVTRPHPSPDAAGQAMFDVINTQFSRLGTEQTALHTVVGLAQSVAGPQKGKTLPPGCP